MESYFIGYVKENNFEEEEDETREKEEPEPTPE